MRAMLWTVAAAFFLLTATPVMQSASAAKEKPAPTKTAKAEGGTKTSKTLKKKATKKKAAKKKTKAAS